MTTGAKLYIVGGTLGIVLCWSLAVFDLTPTPPEVVPVSVRENPASFRPSYSGYTGWHPLPAPSSGGGFGFGK